MEHTRTPLTDSFSAAIIYQWYVLLVYQEAQEMERTETQRKILEVGKKEFLEKGFRLRLHEPSDIMALSE